MEDGEWVVVRRPTETDWWNPSLGESETAKPLKLRFSEPAKHWTDAIPVGNGHLGAMIWGGVPLEKLQLNGKLSALFTVQPLTKSRKEGDNYVSHFYRFQ